MHICTKPQSDIELFLKFIHKNHRRSKQHSVKYYVYMIKIKIDDRQIMDFAKKNEGQSVQLTYPIDSLVIGDVIQVYINNDNVDVDSLVLGRIVAQSWG